MPLNEEDRRRGLNMRWVMENSSGEQRHVPIGIASLADTIGVTDTSAWRYLNGLVRVRDQYIEKFILKARLKEHVSDIAAEWFDKPPQDFANLMAERRFGKWAAGPPAIRRWLDALPALGAGRILEAEELEKALASQDYRNDFGPVIDTAMSLAGTVQIDVRCGIAIRSPAPEIRAAIAAKTAVAVLLWRFLPEQSFQNLPLVPLDRALHLAQDPDASEGEDAPMIVFAGADDANPPNYGFPVHNLPGRREVALFVLIPETKLLAESFIAPGLPSMQALEALRAACEAATQSGQSLIAGRLRFDVVAPP